MSKKISDTSLDDIAESIVLLATNMDERFDRVDERFDRVEGRLDSLESEVVAISRAQREMREWMESIDGRLSGVESDIKEIYDRLLFLEKKFPNVTELEVREVERKLSIVIDWAKEVSKQYNVPMPKI